LNSKFGYWGSGSYDWHDNTSLVVNVNDGVTRQSADKRFPAVYYTSIIG
jgi:hypothetical protein